MNAPAPRVLVVDDDPLQIELVERVLSRDGLDVCGVPLPSSLAAEASRFSPVVVLLDVNIPGATGAELVATIRDAAPRARIVLYSASDPSKLRKLASELAADAWISKSESVIEISRRIKELVLK
jgi:DNA-binding response OmpR family regulator